MCFSILLFSGCPGGKTDDCPVDLKFCFFTQHGLYLLIKHNQFVRDILAEVL